MSYSKSNKLPFENASKLGHLHVIKSNWVKSLIDDFEEANINEEKILDNSFWDLFSKEKFIEPLKQIWVVDGSYVPIKANKKEVAFVKTALMTIEHSKMIGINKEFPHPLLIKNIMKDSALFHATVFPLKNIRCTKGNIYDTIRNIIFDSIKIDEEGLYFETLKWLIYEKWDGNRVNSPSFQCPHCDKQIKEGIEYDKDRDICKECGKEILLTDILGFHLDMNEDNAPHIIASSYMMIMELLMLFTVIRLHWEHKDKKLVSDTLYIKDGPMTLVKQYSKLVPKIRKFLNYAKKIERIIHIIGCEKSGLYFDYLNTIKKSTEEITNQEIKYAVLTHDYIRKEIQRAPEYVTSYGLRTNWGEKVFMIIDRNINLVLNIPTGEYRDEINFPKYKDIIGLDRIMSTIPYLISYKYEGALYPIHLVNGIASMSNYPSAKILQSFIRDSLNK